MVAARSLAMNQAGRCLTSATILIDGNTPCCCRICAKASNLRAEHRIVVRGTAKLTKDDTAFLVSESESICILPGTTHRLETPVVSIWK